MTPIAPHVEAFLREHLPNQRAASQHTCDAYSDALRLLFEYASERLNIAPSDLVLEQLDAPLILDFLEHLETNRRNGVKTRNVRLTAIRSFVRFLEHREPHMLDQIRRILAIPTKRTDQKLVGYLSTTEVQSVLNAPSLETRTGIRDRAMIHLCFAAGLRVSELVSLPLTAVTLHASPSVRVVGKGRKERELPLWKQTSADLRAWVSVRGDIRATELFVNYRGEPMTRSGFEYVLEKHVRAATAVCPFLEGKRVSPHILRHTCAVTVLQATGDIRKVAMWLGHEDVRTTEVYLRANPSEKLETVSAMVCAPLRKGRFRSPDKLMALLRGKRLCGP